jgi:hypothetical protein
MARPKKRTVDYFPHQCNHGKTMFILEQKYGNDGYAFWFKLLELLGTTEGHFLHLENSADWEFLQAKTRLYGDKCREILDLLARLDAIDRELWESHRVVWSQNFVDGIAPVYRNRGVETPSKPSFYTRKPSDGGVSTPENPQSRVEESRVEESTICAPDDAQEDTHDAPMNKPSSKSGPRSPFKSRRQEQLFDEFWAEYPKKRSKGQAEKTWVKLKPDEQLFEAIMTGLKRAKTSVDWAKNGGQYIPYPSTWLNAKGWEDEHDERGIGNDRHGSKSKFDELVIRDDDI